MSGFRKSPLSLAGFDYYYVNCLHYRNRIMELIRDVWSECVVPGEWCDVLLVPMLKVTVRGEQRLQPSWNVQDSPGFVDIVLCP